MRLGTLHDDLISVLKGCRNGLYYGGRVRLAHSLVMMLLFKNISRSELNAVIKNTWEHARNLGLFVLCYKAGCLAL
jgi:peroxisomal membrane protein 4